MYPKLLIRLAAFYVCICLFACSTARVASSPSFVLVGAPPVSKQGSHEAVPSSTRNSANPNIAANNKNASSAGHLVGPLDYVPEPPPASTPKIIEKGGKYVYLPPAYAMRKPENGMMHHSSSAFTRKAELLKKFAIKNNYDTTVAFMVDMSVKSSRKRFFVVDLSNNQIIKEGMVAHGRGAEKFTFDRKFSNGEGSNCTSLGMYKIGKSYNGAFGLSYKLYGLNSTNSNALRRYVVLHAMNSIPDDEAKWPIAQTEGCPAVSPDFLKELSFIIDTAPKNILLCIYDGRQLK